MSADILVMDLSLCQKPNFSTYISLQPDGVHFLYFKLIFFYLTKSLFEISKFYDIGWQRYGD